MASGKARLALHPADGSPVIYPAQTGTLEAWLLTRFFDCGDPTQEKFLEGVLLEIQDISGASGLVLQIGTKNRLTDQTVWTQELDATAGNQIIWLPEIESARYVCLLLKDHTVGGVWKLSALEVLGQLDGGQL